MRQIITTVYKFNELSDEAKEKAIDAHADINVFDSSWYESAYEDAKQAGFDIVEFDIDRASKCTIKHLNTFEESSKYIIENHGDTCETYKIALKYRTRLLGFKQAYEKKLDEISLQVLEEDERDKEEQEASNVFDDQHQYNCDEYLKEMQMAYLSILRNEYEYLTSKECIQEHLEACEYEFTEDGKPA